jgi:hypothetical protein
MLSQTQSATPIGFAKFNSRSHHAVIRVYDEAGNVIEGTSTRARQRLHFLI